MTENLTHSQKYAGSRKPYEETLYRSAFAIRKELKPGLDELVTATGAPSVSALLGLMAREPAHFGELLKADIERLAAEHSNQPRRRLKVTMKSLVEEIKTGELTPEEIAAAIAAAKAQKAAAGAQQ